MKRLITLLLAFVLVMIMAAVPAMAAESDSTDAGIAAQSEAPPAEPDEPQAAEETTAQPSETAATEAPVQIVREKTTDIASTAAENYPILSSVNATKDGVRITWNKYTGAVKYRVYIRNDSSWKKVGDTDKLYYDHKNAPMYTPLNYTVRPMDKNGKFISSYDKNGVFGMRIRNPSVTKIENIAGGVKVTVTPSATTARERLTMGLSLSQDSYRIFVKGGTYGSSWKAIGGSESTTVKIPIDSKNSGKKLTFTVRTLRSVGGYQSYYNSGKTATYVAAPSLKVVSVNGGQQLTVNKVSGASKYRIFIKKGSSWTRLADTASTYTNKNVTASNTYTYTVRALNSAGSYVSGYYGTGYSRLYAATPKLTKLEQSTDCLKLSWGAVKNAKIYKVFRKGPSDKSWQAVALTYTAYFNDYNVEENTKYTYTVRCIDDFGYYTSYYNTAGISQTYYGTPEILYAENSGKGITLGWNTPKFIKKYRVFVKNGTKWTGIADVADDCYTYPDVVEGETYTFTVRGLDKNGNYCSGYYAPGFLVTYYTDAETTVDLDVLKSKLDDAVYWAGSQTHGHELWKENNAMWAFMADTGCYGPNCGDVTDNLFEMSKQRLNTLKKHLTDYHYKLGAYSHELVFEEYEYGYIVYLYLLDR